ncbi:hypothetical protein D6825_01935 [Candidatus Woesearchaeota archaeon]|nr:MAG: hypothetical protein D6825_01935 [Candidatus Woesearchaeota archaeon]
MTKILTGVVTNGKLRYALDHMITCISKQSVPSDKLFVVNNGEDAYATLIRSKNLPDSKVVESSCSAPSRTQRFAEACNLIREHALERDYDYVLLVDGSVMIPALATQLLLLANADVAAGAYLKDFDVGGERVIAPALFKDEGDGNCRLYTYEGAAIPRVFEVGAAGLGCVLVRRRVLEKVKFRSFSESGVDSAFFVDARSSGFKCVANTAVKCLNMPYPISDPRAKLYEWKKSVRSMTVDFKYG